MKKVLRMLFGMSRSKISVATILQGNRATREKEHKEVRSRIFWRKVFPLFNIQHRGDLLICE